MTEKLAEQMANYLEYGLTAKQQELLEQAITNYRWASRLHGQIKYYPNSRARLRMERSRLTGQVVELWFDSTDAFYPADINKEQVVFPSTWKQFVLDRTTE